MLKKEFREIIVPALLRLSMVLIFPLLSLLGVSRAMGNRAYYSSFLGFLELQPSGLQLLTASMRSRVSTGTRHWNIYSLFPFQDLKLFYIN